jgi:serine/threonine protein kinase/Tol biopolymer transport system component
MTPERWAEIERLYHAALERDAAGRAVFLADACEGDDGLRREVESLLAQASDAKGFMSTPATARAGELLSDGAPLIGRTLGPYVIRARLGAGAMGDVYRARDTRLDRDVAMKILPRVFTSDAGRLGRFEREARVLASLNHPHIGAIYGLESIDRIPALVLELVEGDTLAERIAKRPLAVAEGLTIATQIAEALEAAHDRGVVHRDLKPANIMITPAGVVKVLDFGLAKAAIGDEAGADLARAPMVNVGETREGMVLGTPAYMSPEQARGLPVDKRTDVWAFGCVLFEMVSGQPPFVGHTVSDVLASVLQQDPDWTALPAATPLAVRSLLRRCLQKEPSRRLRDMADARFQVEEALSEPAGAAASNPPVPVRSARERPLWVAALGLAIVAGVAGGARYYRTAQPQAEEVHLEINAPPTTDPISFAVSPDGKMIVFAATAGGTSRLWLRSLDSVSARPLAGTENARFPFWSPDSRSVGFSANAQLKRVDIDSGSVRVVVSHGASGGGSWNRDGTILYDPGPGSGLYRVSADGGPRVLVIPSINEARETTGASKEAADPSFPQFLPDQRHFLFYATGTARGIYIAQLGESNAPRRIVDAQAATYASEHLFFVRQGVLLAQPFDPLRLELSGSATVITEHVDLGGAGEAAVSASAAGPIVYRTGTSGPRSQFVWLDRSGKALETVAGSEIGDGFNSSLSPDGRRLALSSNSEARDGGAATSDIWLLDLSRGVPSRFTFDPAYDLMPVWSPDGTRIAFASNRSGPLSVYVKPAAGAGTDELLVATDQANVPSDWSSDGRFILLAKFVRNHYDIWALPLVGDRKAFPLVQTAFNATNAQFSADGKWIAYQSDESGRYEIYVQRFPGPGGKTLISANGGIQVRWRHDGKELFYIGSDNMLMAAPIRPNAEDERVEVGTPMSLFATHLSGTPRHNLGRHYTVSRDGQRFLMHTLKEVVLPLTVVLNWKRKP